MTRKLTPILTILLTSWLGQAQINLRMIPHVTRSGGGFLTEITCNNVTRAKTSITLRPYTQNGEPLQPTTLDISGQPFLKMSADEVFGGQEVSHFLVDGHPLITVTVGYRQVTGGATAQVQESAKSGQLFALFPGEWDLVFDGLAIVNTSDQPADITITHVQANNSIIQASLSFQVAPMNKQLLVLGDHFSEIPKSQFRIHSSQPIRLMSLRGSYPGAPEGTLFECDVINSQQVPRSLRILPHITPVEALYETQLAFTHFGDTPTMLSLRPVTSEGEVGHSIQIEIPANGLLMDEAQSFFEDTAAYVVIDGPDDCFVSASYRLKSGFGPSAQVHETGISGALPRESYVLYQGEWDRVFDGLALINLGDQTASIRAVQINSQGETSEIRTLTTTVAPKSKYLLVLDAIFQDNPGSQIRMVCSQPSMAMLLRGTRPGEENGVLFQSSTVLKYNGSQRFEEGTLYACQNGSDQVIAITPQGQESVVANLTKPGGLAFHDGILLVSEHTAMGRILALVPDAQGLSTPLVLADNLPFPKGMAPQLGLDQGIAVTTRGDGRVIQIKNEVPMELASGFTDPFGICADDSGNLFLGDFGDGLLVKFDTQTQLTSLLMDGLNRPAHLTMDRTGVIAIPEDHQISLYDTVQASKRREVFVSNFIGTQDLSLDSAIAFRKALSILVNCGAIGRVHLQPFSWQPINDKGGPAIEQEQTLFGIDAIITF